MSDYSFPLHCYGRTLAKPPEMQPEPPLSDKQAVLMRENDTIMKQILSDPTNHCKELWDRLRGISTEYATA